LGTRGALRTIRAIGAVGAGGSRRTLRTRVAGGAGGARRTLRTHLAILARAADQQDAGQGQGGNGLKETLLSKPPVTKGIVFSAERLKCRAFVTWMSNGPATFFSHFDYSLSIAGKAINLIIMHI